MTYHWTKEDYELLRTTGTVPGKSPKAIRRAQLRLGLRKKCNPRRPWTAEAEQQLISLFNQGLSARQIVRRQLMPFTETAIQKKLCRLGLAQKCPMFKFSPAWQDRLKEFLKANWVGKTPAELAELWSKQYPTRASNAKRVAAYLRRMGIKVCYGEVQRIRNQRRREARILKKSGMPLDKKIEQIRLSRAKFMRGRLERNRDIWTGMTVTEEELADK